MVRKNGFWGGGLPLASQHPWVLETPPTPIHLFAKTAPAPSLGLSLKVTSRDSIPLLMAKSHPPMLPKPPALVTPSRGSPRAPPDAVLPGSSLPDGRALAFGRCHSASCLPEGLTAPPAPRARGRREAGLAVLGRHCVSSSKHEGTPGRPLSQTSHDEASTQKGSFLGSLGSKRGKSP